jgi:hypothetical protein
MKVIKIDKKEWAHEAFFVFKALEDGELPDLDVQNTRLSPRSVIYPQSEKMFEYTLDETKLPAFAKIRYISAVRKNV